MNRILKIGMDVHSTNYTICAIEPVIGAEDRIYGPITVAPNYKNILLFIEDVKTKCGLSDTYSIECGYEAGCLGYSLYNDLTGAGVKCVILAPSTMLTPQGSRIKTDARDAIMIGKCLAYGGYHPVYVPTEDDDAVKEYIRMRDDHKTTLVALKQQINALCLRHGYHYSGTKWTGKHLSWLKDIKLSPLYRETLNEYLSSYYEITEKIGRYDERIKELASQEKYQNQVKELGCLLGIKTHTALSLVVETGDFKRFAKGNIYSSFLGLTPGESSSGNHVRRGGITKAGNNHLRKLLIEAAQGICRGTVGYKSKELRARQAGNRPEVIAYADKANRRMRSRYYKLTRNGKKKNVAVAAVARELACFVWGIMTDNINVA